MHSPPGLFNHRSISMPLLSCESRKLLLVSSGRIQTSLLSGNKEDGWLRSLLEVTAAHPDSEKKDAKWKDESFLSLK